MLHDRLLCMIKACKADFMLTDICSSECNATKSFSCLAMPGSKLLRASLQRSLIILLCLRCTMMLYLAGHGSAIACHPKLPALTCKFMKLSTLQQSEYTSKCTTRPHCLVCLSAGKTGGLNFKALHQKARQDDPGTL